MKLSLTILLCFLASSAVAKRFPEKIPVDLRFSEDGNALEWGAPAVSEGLIGYLVFFTSADGSEKILGNLKQTSTYFLLPNISSHVSAYSVRAEYSTNNSTSWISAPDILRSDPFEKSSNLENIEIVEKRKRTVQSALLPGLGQFNRGQKSLGVLYMATFAGLLSGSIYYHREGDKLYDQYLLASTPANAQTLRANTESADRLFSILVTSTLLFYTWNLIDASTFTSRKIEQVVLSTRSDGLTIAWQGRF